MNEYITKPKLISGYNINSEPVKCVSTSNFQMLKRTDGLWDELQRKFRESRGRDGLRQAYLYSNEVLQFELKANRMRWEHLCKMEKKQRRLKRKEEAIRQRDEKEQFRLAYEQLSSIFRKKPAEQLRGVRLRHRGESYRGSYG